MSDKISRRIADVTGAVDLPEILADKLSGTELHSLLLDVFKRRVSKVQAHSLAAPDSIVDACNIDARLLHTVERLQQDSATEYEAVELSPVNPLGTLSRLTGLDQANALSTIRALECTPDPTLGLAIECARRRKNPKARKFITRLCTSQRVLRFPRPNNPAYTAHFKLFCLVAAGRDMGSFAFQVASLREHVGIYLSIISELQKKEHGGKSFVFQDIVVEVSDMRVVSHLCSRFGIEAEEVRSSVRARNADSARQILASHNADWPAQLEDAEKQLAQLDVPEWMRKHVSLLDQLMLKPLSGVYPQVQFQFNLHRLTGLGYYRGPCFHIKAKNLAGDLFTLADGGLVDWTRALLSDDKERLMTSAIGTEQLCRMFLV